MTSATRTDETIRRDLIGALAGCVAEKGYAATTIADIVAMAHVSKRTFYEHFAGKEDCLLGLYELVSGNLMKVIRGASGEAAVPWRVLVTNGAAAFLSALDSMPEFSRTLLVEMQGAGPRSFQMRQETLRRFAQTIVDLVDLGRETNPDIGPLTTAQALAMVGGIHELLLQAIDKPSRPDRPFSALHADVVLVVSAILTYKP